MLNVDKIRQDFPMLQHKTMQDQPLIYLDNGATTLKPRQVIDAVVNYYENYGANAHRGDYDLSYLVDQEYAKTRKSIASFIHADENEVVFTSGATLGLNMVALGLGSKILQKGDVILTTEAEHASCILPWMREANKVGASIQYIPIREDGRIHAKDVKALMSEQVKVVTLAHVGNVLGYIAPMKEICKIAHEYGAIVIMDAAQSAPHMKLDVKDIDCDFMAFSSHKMCGPTGIGVLYGKKELLDKMDPLLLGGDSNARFETCGHYTLKDAPYKFESGTQPLEAIFGFHAAIQYLQEIGMNKIHEHEKELHDYAIEQLKDIPSVILYNENNDTGIITFNIKDVFAQDAASYFNANGIAVRSGQHCAKLLNAVLHTDATIRASFYFYNTKADVDRFVEVCKKVNRESCLDIFF